MERRNERQRLRSSAATLPLIRTLLALCVVGTFGCQSLRDPHVLRVGSDLANPPFAFVDDAGEPLGKEPEMMRGLARELHMDLEWHRMEFAELLDAIEAGEIDVACATMGITAERARRVGFSNPYFETSIAVLVRHGASEPTSIDDLTHLRVAAARGTTSEFAVREVLPDATWHFGAEKDGPVVERLLTSVIDAAVMDGPNAAALAKEHASLWVLPEPLAAERYAIAIDPTYRGLVERINLALAQLRGRGELPLVEAK